MYERLDINSHTTPEKVENILNEWDRKILLEGGKNVVEKILKEFRGKLPDGIIYPDTSARPLHYLFDPIFSKISEQLKNKKPQTFFFKIRKPDFNTRLLEDIEGREVSYDEVKSIMAKKVLDGIKNKDDEDYFPYRLSVEDFKAVEDSHTIRATEQERASEIEKYNEKLSRKGMIANLAVIDEFSNEGETSKEIDYAFGYKIPYFAVFALPRQDDNFIPDENKGLIIDYRTYPENPKTSSNTKLSYAAGADKKFVGVDKYNDVSDKYSSVNNLTEKDSLKIKQLRQEMKEIGLKIAESL